MQPLSNFEGWGLTLAAYEKSVLRMQYCDWNNKKLKGCVNNNTVKKLKKNYHCIVGCSRLLNRKHEILTIFTATMVIVHTCKLQSWKK